MCWRQSGARAASATEPPDPRATVQVPRPRVEARTSDLWRTFRIACDDLSEPRMGTDSIDDGRAMSRL